MPSLSEVILSLFASFTHVFTVPTWKYAKTLLIGAILCNGKRTVSSALRAVGLSQESRFERYHRVLSKAKWNAFSLSRILLGLLVETQRQWSELAIKLTTPVLFGLFSIICLIAYRQNQRENDLVKACSTAWYDKEDNATFSGVITYVKRLILLGKCNYYKSACNDEFVKIRWQDLEILIHNGLMAA